MPMVTWFVWSGIDEFKKNDFLFKKDKKIGYWRYLEQLFVKNDKNNYHISGRKADLAHARKLNSNDVMGKYNIIGEDTRTETCLECGTVFYGPPNKKFCCDSCRNRYHNREHQGMRNVKLRTHTILDKNYRILSDLLANNILAIDRGDLYMMGYTPGYLTSVIRTRTHEQCTCYDISFRRTETKVCNIHKIGWHSSGT